MTLKLYIIALLIFLAIDAFWLGWVAPQFYQSQIGHLMAESANLAAAAVFYLLYIGALVYFVVEPAVQAGSIRQAALRGALFGLVAYGTYYLTNLGTLRDWPLLVTVVDLAWGTILTAATAAASLWVAQKIH